MNVVMLYELAKRVANTHNGKSFPRHEQIKAIQALQSFMISSPSLDLASSAAEPVSLELPPLKP
jgi:hypothetical protein